MRKIPPLLLVLALIFTALASAPNVFSASDAVPPKVIDTAPTAGEELPVDGSVTFFFDQSMDRGSVEAAFRAEPSVAGRFEWLDDAAVRFTPNGPLERASEYIFRITEGARSTENVPLKDLYTLRLRTSGFLEVTQIIPANGTQEIETTPTITVVFNRPVVPLMVADEMANLPSPITIEPAVEGTGEWLNTSVYQFKPTALRGGTGYTVTVKAGLSDVTGSILRDDVVARFTTVSPRVTEILPREESSRVLRDREIYVAFSQPMDRAAVEQAFSLSGPNGPVRGTFTWNERSTNFTFKASSLLDYNTIYNVRVDEERALSATGAPITSSAQTSFRVIPLPEIVQTWPQHEAPEQRESGLTFRFSAPMDLKDFKKRIRVEPEPQLTFTDYGDDDGFYYTFSFSHEPSTSYTATLDVDGLTDIYGTPLLVGTDNVLYDVVNGDIVLRWTTAAYPPEASLRTGTLVGLYSAYNPITRVFSTHRNIDQISLDISAVPLNRFLELIANPYGRVNETGVDILRQWSVRVENPQNVLRYDLLTISDQGANVPLPAQCDGAPPSRIFVEDEIIVLPDDPTPLRLRQAAGLNARVITQVPINTALVVVDGPVCQDGYTWWNLQGVDNPMLTGWGAEGSATQYFIGKRGMTSRVEPRSNQPAQPLAPNAEAPALKPGLYRLRMSSPELRGGRPMRHYMIVATANVALKVTERSVLAWVTDLQSGQPIPNVTLQFVNGTFGEWANGARPFSMEPLGEATTDADGMAMLELPKRLETLYTEMFAVLDNDVQFGIGALNFDNGIENYMFNQPSDYYPDDLTAYLYSDRSLYRPGQPVYFRGIVRAKDDMTYTLPESTNVYVEVLEPADEVVYSKSLPLSAFGSFSDKFDISEFGRLGSYRIEVRVGFNPERDTRQNWRGRVYTRVVTVAQYRVPEFQVNVTADETNVVQGDTIRVKVNSTYFFGGAVSNARVNWSAFSEKFFFRYRGAGFYQFYDYNEDEAFREQQTDYGNEVSNGVGQTDAQGNFVIELPANLGERSQSQTYTIDARITDESDQQIAGRVQVVVHQGEFYIGAGPEEYVGVAGKPQQINLITVNPDNTPRPNIDLSIRVVERRWNSVQTVEPATGRTVWNYEVKEEPVTTGEARTDADGKTRFEFTPPRGGVYKVYATSRDSRGNQITTSTFMWVAGPNYVPWRQQNSNRIDLKIDRSDYRVGDRASLLIASPFQGETKALITFERGGILKREVVTMPTNSYVYEFEITPDMAPNAFVSVMIVKGVDETNPVSAFRMGLIGFGVETERLVLNIQVTPDREQAGPRETVNYKIKVTDFQGEPVQAEVGVGLTDLAVLSLLPDTSRPILNHFYSEAGLGVRTASTLTVSVDQQTQEILNTIKGGGGGGPEGGIFEVRQRFIDTPLWLPTVETDQNGEATVTVTLPDQLTTWRLDARAVTKAIGELGTTLVGQTTSDLISTKPLLIRPVTPRFFVARDQSTLVAIVNNNSGADQDVTARIELTGAVLKDSAEKTVRVANLGRARFEWPIEVGDGEAIDVTFFASSADGRFTDAAKSAVGQGDDKTLPIMKYEVPETVGTGGSLMAGGTQAEGISLPRRYDVTEGELIVRLDRSLAASTVDALEVLRYFPYYCTEQTISRFLPNVATLGAFTRLGVQNDQLRQETNEAVSQAVQRLYNEQRVGGGWGWFFRDRGNPLVTAYALLGLVEARDNGFNIDEGVIENAIRFLQRYAEEQTLGPRPSTWVLNRLAFINYALARADAGNFSRAVLLFDRRDLMGVYARAFLAMTFHRIDPRNTTYTDPLVSDLVSRAVVSATGAHWEESFQDWFNWNTDTRTTAIVLKALIALQPENPLVSQAVRWIMTARQADSWETTQETAWAVLALTDYMVFTGELQPAYTFGATLNGNALASGETAAPENVRESEELRVQVADLLKDGVNRLVIERSAGPGALYYTAHLRVNLPVEQIQPAERGISIRRTYSLATDPEAGPITSATVGDTIRVTLDIVATRDLHYVVIDDPIPAGTEALNPELATTAIGQAPQLRLDDPFGRGFGWWWFSEIEMRDEKLVIYATYLPQGTYRYTYSIRAGLPGEYRVIPPTAQEFYFPEVYGRGAGVLFPIRAATDAANDPTNPQPTPTATPGQ